MAIIRIKHTKIRKDHSCWGCNRKFTKGSYMFMHVCTDGLLIKSIYWCETCKAYWRLYMESDDEINRGSLKYDDFDGWNKIREIVEIIQKPSKMNENVSKINEND